MLFSFPALTSHSFSLQYLYLSLYQEWSSRRKENELHPGWQGLTGGAGQGKKQVSCNKPTKAARLHHTQHNHCRYFKQVGNLYQLNLVFSSFYFFPSPSELIFTPVIRYSTKTAHYKVILKTLT